MTAALSARLTGSAGRGSRLEPPPESRKRSRSSSSQVLDQRRRAGAPPRPRPRRARGGSTRGSRSPRRRDRAGTRGRAAAPRGPDATRSTTGASASSAPGGHGGCRLPDRGDRDPAAHGALGPADREGRAARAAARRERPQHRGARVGGGECRAHDGAGGVLAGRPVGAGLTCRSRVPGAVAGGPCSRSTAGRAREGVHPAGVVRGDLLGEVGDDDDGHGVQREQAHEHLPQRDPRLAVQAAERLVEEDRVGDAREAPGQGRPLLHAARELGGHLRLLAREARLGEQVLREAAARSSAACPRTRGGAPCCPRRCATAAGGRPGTRSRCARGARSVPADGREQARGELQQRGLADARVARDHRDLAGAHREVRVRRSSGRPRSHANDTPSSTDAVPGLLRHEDATSARGCRRGGTTTAASRRRGPARRPASLPSRGSRWLNTRITRDQHERPGEEPPDLQGLVGGLDLEADAVVRTEVLGRHRGLDREHEAHLERGAEERARGGGRPARRGGRAARGEDRRASRRARAAACACPPPP